MPEPGSSGRANTVPAGTWSSVASAATRASASSENSANSGISLSRVASATSDFISRDPQLDLARGSIDLLHPHGHRVSEPERATGAPSFEGGPQLVQLVVVAAERARGHVALEHVGESNEDSRHDRARDLSIEGVLPTQIE